VRHLVGHPLIARLGQHVGKPLGLKVIDGVDGLVGVHHVRHEPAHDDGVLGNGAAQRGQHRRVLARRYAIAIQPGVDLDGDWRGPAGAAHRVQQLVELALRGHGDLNVGQPRGPEVDAGRVQPGQHRRGDAGGAQRQCLLNGGDTQLGRPRGQRGARRLGRSVAVAIGLDDSHHLRAGLLAQQPYVVLNGAQVDQGLGEEALGQGYRGNGHGRHCPRSRESAATDAATR
jgi:hypothetical protein